MTTRRRLNRNEDRTIERMVTTGRSWLDAYATVTGADLDRLHSEELAALLDVDRRAGESRTVAANRLHGEHLDQHYRAAEDACRGTLLNAAGRARGIDPRKLFYGPATRAYKYASEELVDWWRTHPRVTQVEYRAAHTGQRCHQVAAQVARTMSVDLEFAAG